MADQTTTLAEIYAGWAAFQRNLLRMISPLTPEQLALPTGPHHWPVGTVLQHLVGNRVFWFQQWMGEGDPALAPLAGWDPASPAEPVARDAPALVAGFEETWGMIADALGRRTVADLGQHFSPPAGLSDEERELFGERSRRWIIWHVAEHEIVHVGELSLALGSHGLPGIYGDI